MTLRPAFLMCVRNKVAHVRETAQRLLHQTYEPMTVVFSDHWSNDGTSELLWDMASSYCGPHEVIVLRCPLTDRRGILGLNAHLDWVIRRIDADVIFFSSADDVQYANRVERVMQVWRDNPDIDYIATRCQFRLPGGRVQNAPLIGSGRVDLKTNLAHQIGFKTGGAYKRDLWLRHGPMRGIEAPDLILPSLAALEGKMYYLDEALHDSLHVPDRDGVSVERAMQAAEGTDDHLPLIELNQYQFASSHFSLARRLNEMNAQLDTETTAVLMGKLIMAADFWAQWRDRLTMSRVQPLRMNA